MLEKLRKMTKGDEKRVQLYIESYIDGMTINIHALKEALADENYHEIGAIVHRAIPMFATMGFDGLTRLANHVEMSVNKRHSQQITVEHTNSLIEDIQESINQLKDL